MKTWYFIFTLFVSIFLARISYAQNYTLFKSFEASDEIHSIIINKGNSQVLFLESDTNKTDTVKAWLSPFVSATGEAIYPTLSTSSGFFAADSTYLLGYQTALSITHGHIDYNGKYDGYLVIKKKNQEPTRLKVILKRDSLPQCRLLLTRSVIDLEETNIWKTWGRSKLKFSTVLYADNLSDDIILPKIRLTENTETPNYFVVDDIEVSIKGHEEYDLLNSSIDDSARLAPRNQYTIEGTISGIPMGDNTLKLQFFALNAPVSESPVLTLNARKKSSIWGSLIFIILGIAFSFFTKKRVAIIKERIKIAKRADRIINNFTDRTRPYNLAFNRLNRIHKMVATISQLKNSDFAEQEKALDTSELIAKYLKRTDRLYDHINAIANGMQRRRALKHYNRIIERLADEDLTDPDRIEKPLAELESWFESGVFSEAKYEENLLADINYFTSKASIAEITTNAPKYIVQVQELWDQMVSGSGKTPIERENCYATLKVLWEWRNDVANFEKVIAAYLKDQNVEDLFKVTDQLHWDKLIDNTPVGTPPPISFISPLNEVVEFEPIYFEIRPDEPENGNNYLYKHGITYEWAITINKKKPHIIETEEPNVTFYSIETGKLSAKVNGRFGKKYFPAPVEINDINIKSSSSRSLLVSTNSLERISIGAAVVLAIISGIKAFYLTDAFLGTFQDYIGLFLWAAALELGAGALADLKSDP